MDHKQENKSELLAVTTTLDCHWYCVSDAETGVAERGMESREHDKCIEVELLAVLKRTDLSTKLRKMDFREFQLTSLPLNLSLMLALTWPLPLPWPSAITIYNCTPH